MIDDGAAPYCEVVNDKLLEPTAEQYLIGAGGRILLLVTLSILGSYSFPAIAFLRHST
jgi:hypothetical protein